MNDSVQNALPLQIDLTVTGVSLGNPDGTWRVHIRDTATGKWKYIGYFTVTDREGSFFINFEKPTAFDAYICTRNSRGGWSGKLQQVLSELTYRVYD